MLNFEESILILKKIKTNRGHYVDFLFVHLNLNNNNIFGNRFVFADSGSAHSTTLPPTELEVVRCRDLS